MFDTSLPFSSENDDKVFNPGILASNEEKSPHLLYHWGFKAFQVTDIQKKDKNEAKPTKPSTGLEIA
ncbi:hypothetical protein Tco_0976314 [Tanacetum coccineum]|uniref:Uncharacterized protein n=1 Tax=Tanacetum coccineum TaxID=301880 RepID=A0ABQ5EI08_9ASTR